MVMAHKQVLFRSAAREKILRGATQLADSIRVTLGPRSKAVLIEKKWGVPVVCNDGVTIAKEFDLKDPKRISARVCFVRPLKKQVTWLVTELVRQQFLLMRFSLMACAMW